MESREIWKDYNDKQDFEHLLINRKPTWSLTTQGILFAAYGLTLSGKALQGVSEFRSAVAVSGLMVAALTLIGVAFLIRSKIVSYTDYHRYFGSGACLPGPLKDKPLKWGAAGMVNTMFTLLPDFGTPVVFIVAWSCAARKLDRVVDLPVLPARLVR